MADVPTALRTSDYKRPLAIFSAASAAWVFVLVSLGAFTTSIGAGMAFPDWPLSNGSLNPSGWMENLSMLAEHSHRLTGWTMGLLTIVLAFWLWRTEARGWLRKLGLWALVIVVIQGLLGGTRVLLDPIHVPGFQMSLGQMLRIPHGILAQIYACVLIAIAVACTRGWIERPLPVGDAVRKLGLACCGLLLVQLTVAATMRHNGAGLAILTFPYSTADGHWLPASWNFGVAIHFTHRVLAAILAVALTAFVFVVRRDRASTLAMRAAASALLSLMVLQILLGAEIIRTFRHADVTTGHVLVGALTLATTFWLTWVAHRDAIESRRA
ncbi:MAG TPA: COX15/CtaA family protein [Opitutaceae bacterium]|nr:COX15/CtaA family protein [Opitutaceae bacterium]